MDAVDRLIGHWQERQSDMLQPLVFKAYKGRDGSLVNSAAPKVADRVEGEHSWCSKFQWFIEEHLLADDSGGEGEDGESANTAVPGMVERVMYNSTCLVTY